jgi:hypothetical protein
MPTDEQRTEQEIQKTNPSTNRVTPDKLDEVIVAEQFYVFPGTTLTVCALTLKNGFVVTGTSAAADPDNFNEKIGQDIARERARNEVWQLEGYLVRQRLYDESNDEGEEE